MRPHREVDKPLATRTVELVHALLVMADSLREVRRGRAHQLIPLFGQMRALLTDRAKGAEPLLLAMATALAQRPTVFCDPAAIDNGVRSILGDNLVMSLSGFQISTMRQFPGQEEISFEEILSRNIVFYKGREYSVRDLIDWFANRAGGAHYSRRLPADFAELLSLHVNERRMLVDAMLPLADATLAVGRDLLKRKCDVSIHLLLVLPKQKIATQTYIVDTKHPHVPMRISLLLTDLMGLEFRVSGIQGIGASITSDRLLTWSSVHHIEMSSTIENDLSTRLEISFDGVRVARGHVPEPLFVLADSSESETFWNRGVDGPLQESSLGVVKYVVAAPETEPRQRAALFMMFDERKNEPENKCIAYFPGSFGQRAPTSPDIKMHGTVKQLSVEDFLASSPSHPASDAEPA